MSALQLVDLDEISGRFAMAGILYFSWRDESLTWDPNQYNKTLWMMRKNFEEKTLLVQRLLYFSYLLVNEFSCVTSSN
jgi:hypothetical protein